MNLAYFGKCNAQVYVLMKDVHSNKYNEIGKTEIISSSDCPQFVTPLRIQYDFTRSQQLKISVVNACKPGGVLSEQDLIGDVLCTVPEIARFMAITRQIKHIAYKEPGVLRVIAEEIQQQDDSGRMTVTFTGSNLDKKDFFGKSDPYFLLSRLQHDSTFSPIYKSEVIKRTLDPHWRPFSMDLQTICNGDYTRPIKFECLDWNISGKPSFIGEATFNFHELQSNITFPLLNSSLSLKKSSYTNSGTITSLTEMSRDLRYTFLDYLRGGCSISLLVGIDFTNAWDAAVHDDDKDNNNSISSSGGGGGVTDGKHTDTNNNTNETIQALRSVCQILNEYDDDKKISLFGIGMRQLDDRKASSSGVGDDGVIPLGEGMLSEVVGVDGVVKAYRDATKNWRPAPIVKLSPLIRHVNEICSSVSVSQDRQHYFILLVVVTGEVHDMDSAINEIVKASRLPLSIVLVGVGSRDFSAERVLDADDTRLRSSDGSGEVQERDNVQFVQYLSEKYETAASNEDLLAEDTLKEIPAQLIGWMAKRKIIPGKKQTV
eukprot:TRINITY_DN4766_c0_g1_i2.p1 TRINITY_DN4766_c0_g1~~TRINITY_DN4766_c0_g1_i2.p1  ORF type:complete len:583 (-),score=120.76 TRINITY_DN4766_c0_g1_i2:60-1691(-)